MGVFDLALRAEGHCPTSNRLEACVCMGFSDLAMHNGIWALTAGGGGGWHFNFAREISGFKLTAKFRTQNSGFLANFSHTSSAHCGLLQGVPHKIQGAPRDFPQQNLPLQI